jgi:hypothetical protein
MKLNYKLKLVFAVLLVTSQIALSQTSSQTNLLGQINTITTAVPFLGISPEASVPFPMLIRLQIQVCPAIIY